MVRKKGFPISTHGAMTSPDGQYVYCCGPSVQVYDAQGGFLQRLPKLGNALAALSPDGRHAAFTHPTDRGLEVAVYRIGPVHEEVARVMIHHAAAPLEKPCFTADSRHLLVSAGPVRQDRPCLWLHVIDMASFQVIHWLDAEEDTCCASVDAGPQGVLVAMPGTVMDRSKGRLLLFRDVTKPPEVIPFCPESIEAVKRIHPNFSLTFCAHWTADGRALITYELGSAWTLDADGKPRCLQRSGSGMQLAHLTPGEAVKVHIDWTSPASFPWGITMSGDRAYLAAVSLVRSETMEMVHELFVHRVSDGACVRHERAAGPAFSGAFSDHSNTLAVCDDGVRFIHDLE